MSKINVGDRVAIYGHNSIMECTGYRGTVVAVELDSDSIHFGRIRVHVEKQNTKVWVHPKQCRKLKKKERGRYQGECYWRECESTRCSIIFPVLADHDLKKFVDKRTRVTIEVLEP